MRFGVEEADEHVLMDEMKEFEALMILCRSHDANGNTELVEEYEALWIYARKMELDGWWVGLHCETHCRCRRFGNTNSLHNGSELSERMV